MEEWRDIPGYERLYQASTEGQIRTHAEKVTSSARFPERHWRQRVLKYRGNNYQTGYRVSLWKNGKCKDWLVSRLVAMTFLRLPKDGETVNHIDGNRFNNRVKNLEWLSLADNIRAGFETGLYPQKEICLVNKSKRSALFFRSESQASLFLGYNNGYISSLIKRGKHESGDYIIVSLNNSKRNAREAS